MKENRAPSTLWMLRHPSEDKNGYVGTLRNDLVQVVFYEPGEYGQQLVMSRKDARLLAKRINQCLDATVKR